MGFVKRNLELEEYLDSVEIKWEHLKGQDYIKILSTFNEIIDSENYWTLTGDKAFSEIENKLPLDCYIFSAPGHKLFSVYDSGGQNTTTGYSVENLAALNREKLNHIECVVSDKQLTFACVFNHEWNSTCPELYLQKKR